MFIFAALPHTICILNFFGAGATKLIIRRSGAKVKAGDTEMKRWIAAAVCAALCLALCGCAGNTVMLRSVAQQGEENAARAQSCAAPVLPDALRAPATDGALNTLLCGEVLSGAFTAVNTCETPDFLTDGSVTVCVQAAPDDGGAPAEARAALWRATANGAEYLETAVFECDGAARAYTFTGLAAGQAYRLMISYTDSAARRMTGAFTVDGVTARLADDEADGEAVLVDVAVRGEEEESEESG